MGKKKPQKLESNASFNLDDFEKKLLEAQ